MNPASQADPSLTSAATGQCDLDPTETREWLEALDAIVLREGKERAQYLFDRLADHALQRGVQSQRARVTPYRNSIPLARQPHYPGDVGTVTDGGFAALGLRPELLRSLEELGY